jgi:hypothetical protein
MFMFEHTAFRRRRDLSSRRAVVLYNLQTVVGAAMLLAVILIGALGGFVAAVLVAFAAPSQPHVEGFRRAVMDLLPSEPDDADPAYYVEFARWVSTSMLTRIVVVVALIPIGVTLAAAFTNRRILFRRSERVAIAETWEVGRIRRWRLADDGWQALVDDLPNLEPQWISHERLGNPAAFPSRWWRFRRELRPWVLVAGFSLVGSFVLSLGAMLLAAREMLLGVAATIGDDLVPGAVEASEARAAILAMIADFDAQLRSMGIALVAVVISVALVVWSARRPLDGIPEVRAPDCPLAMRVRRIYADPDRGWLAALSYVGSDRTPTARPLDDLVALSADPPVPAEHMDPWA